MFVLSVINITQTNKQTDKNTRETQNTQTLKLRWHKCVWGRVYVIFLMMHTNAECIIKTVEFYEFFYPTVC